MKTTGLLEITCLINQAEAVVAWQDALVTMVHLSDQDLLALLVECQDEL